VGHVVLDALNQVSLALAAPVPNPAPIAPPGVSDQMADIVGYVKWGVLLVIIIAAFVGVGSVAGGRVFAHHGASRVGVSILISSIIAAVLYVGIYSFLTSITG
jgi:hypothetical protein